MPPSPGGREGARRVFDMLQIRQGGGGDADEAAAVVPREYPLHLDGAERMRFRYALFLLNKVGPGCSAVGPACCHWSYTCLQCSDHIRWLA